MRIVGPFHEIVKNCADVSQYIKLFKISVQHQQKLQLQLEKIRTVVQHNYKVFRPMAGRIGQNRFSLQAWNYLKLLTAWPISNWWQSCKHTETTLMTKKKKLKT